MKRNKITKNESNFPSSLLTIAQVPDSLFWRGKDLAEILERPKVAIVGSRKASPYGRTVTTKLARELSQTGVVIISGLALGVDSIAHHAALEAHGSTIAVLPCGIDTIYPASHFGLAKQILQSGGTLISEYDGDTLPMKHQFIARNCIIAGLADAVLITEAAAKSGSLHTAEFALEQGKEVFAVPGNITSSTSEGTNQLIKQGATPVTSVQDILDALGIEQAENPNAQTPTNDALLNLIREGVTDSQTLQFRSKLSAAEFAQKISMLELDRLIQVTGQTIVLR